jgi:hypothetical protein
MRQQMTMVGRGTGDNFRPLPFSPAYAAPRGELSSPGPRGLGAARHPALSRRLGQNPFTAVQRAFEGQSVVPNWAIYTSSGLLVVGGIMGLALTEEKTILTYGLNLGMIGLGAYLFYGTVK